MWHVHFKFETKIKNKNIQVYCKKKAACLAGSGLTLIWCMGEFSVKEVSIT